MQGTAKSIFRSVMAGAIALGFMGTMAMTTDVAAQSGVVCSPNPALELADTDNDGIVTIAEIDRVIRLSGNNADLQAARDQAVAQGVTGVQYRDCTPGGGETPAPTTAPGGQTPAPTATTAPGGQTPAPTTAPGGQTPAPTTAPGGQTPAPTTAPGGQTPGGQTPGGGGGVSGLPDTGSGDAASSDNAIWLIAAAGSAVAAAGAATFRSKKA